MGMVKMKHINIYGPEQDPQQTLEVLAKLACFHPDKDAERINAAAGAAENLYTPLLASTLGLIKDVGGDPALQEYRGSILLICHEPEFYRDVVSQVWDCSKWTTKVL